MEFLEYKALMQKHLKEMMSGATHLFEVDLDKDVLWNLYLDSFPAGTNEIFRERRQHDCSCCRSFIRNIGNMVVIKNNKVITIWDFETGSPEEYQPVVDAMRAFVRSKLVTNVYVSKLKKIGTDKNFEEIGGNMHQWNHLYFELPDQFVDKSGKSEGDIQGSFRAIKDVFKRSLDELSADSVETVLELIASNTLYKGEEWKNALTDFLKHKLAYVKLKSEEAQDNYAWEQSVKVGPVVGKIRNHSIGTLLIDISEGVDLDNAVKKYEKVVAPANYKRPKAIFTQKMLDDARKTIEDLGYLNALGRRYGRLDDITVNNILFSNKDSAKRIQGAADIFGEMSKDIAVNPKKFSKVEEIAIGDFINSVLPTAKELEIFLENKHAANMVSLIAPQDMDALSMFKWNNPFSWAYSGNITDSDLTERVRAAGGRTDGVLRLSHSWNYPDMRNASLMDLHVFMPGSTQKVAMHDGKEIHDNYGNGERVGWNNRSHPASGGVQDVDYTAAAPVNYIPVENITFPSMDRLKEGIYTFKIHNWNLRQPTTGGFKAEIAFGGQVYKFEVKRPLAHKEWITLAKLELKNGEFRIIEMMENSTSPIEVWGVKTHQFIPASVVMFSPNYWDEQDGIGHRHYFFMLKGCVNPENPNGFYNEFLKEELMQHKRVFEALGSKMAVKDVEDQLSGVGFSSTKRNDLIVKVKGQTERILKIKF